MVRFVGAYGSKCGNFVTLNWMKHYLNDRKQFVSYNNTTSVSLKVTCVVPQGSISGPLLFILYINDIANVSNISKINPFADDISLFHKHENVESLIKETNEELIRISTWLATNKHKQNELHDIYVKRQII